MTTFFDGPAAGRTLMLKRAPLFLRVVQDGQDWDALDQVGDRPQPAEVIHVYRLMDLNGTVHLNLGRGRGGWYPRAVYRLHERQPEEAVVRDTPNWQAWCQVEAARIKAGEMGKEA